jgi:hypothetical protein
MIYVCLYTLGTSSGPTGHVNTRALLTALTSTGRALYRQGAPSVGRVPLHSLPPPPQDTPCLPGPLPVTSRGPPLLLSPNVYTWRLLRPAPANSPRVPYGARPTAHAADIRYYYYWVPNMTWIDNTQNQQNVIITWLCVWGMLTRTFVAIEEFTLAAACFRN